MATATNQPRTSQRSVDQRPAERRSGVPTIPRAVPAGAPDGARIPLDHPRGGLTTRFVEWYTRRRFGTVMDPAQAMLHNPKVLRASFAFEQRVARFDALDPTLKGLAVMVTSASIGCSWCLDFGYWLHHEEGLDRAKIDDVPRWRESDAYTPCERLVMEYAEAVTANPPTVTDELVSALREELSDAALVELTQMIAIENLRSRFNAALGLTSQGFKERCSL